MVNIGESLVKQKEGPNIQGEVEQAGGDQLQGTIRPTGKSLEELVRDGGEQVKEQTRAGENLVEENWREVLIAKRRCLGETDVCSMCGLQFEKRGNFNRHIEDMHKAKEGGWECLKSFCVEKFPTKHQMLVHRATCIFSCPNCAWSTHRADRVGGHLRVCK